MGTIKTLYSNLSKAVSVMLRFIFDGAYSLKPGEWGCDYKIPVLSLVLVSAFNEVLFFRNRLKYALSAKEVQTILKQRLVKIDGKIRTDPK